MENAAGRWSHIDRVAADRVVIARLRVLCIRRRAAAVLVETVIVGTILNLINQGDALRSGGKVNLTKILLTYAVPYCVATYGAVSFRFATMRANAPIENGHDRHAAD